MPTNELIRDVIDDSLSAMRRRCAMTTRVALASTWTFSLTLWWVGRHHVSTAHHFATSLPVCASNNNVDWRTGVVLYFGFCHSLWYSKMADSLVDWCVLRRRKAAELRPLVVVSALCTLIGCERGMTGETFVGRLARRRLGHSSLMIMFRTNGGRKPINTGMFTCTSAVTMKLAADLYGLVLSHQVFSVSRFRLVLIRLFRRFLLACCAVERCSVDGGVVCACVCVTWRVNLWVASFLTTCWRSLVWLGRPLARRISTCSTSWSTELIHRCSVHCSWRQTSTTTTTRGHRSPMALRLSVCPNVCHGSVLPSVRRQLSRKTMPFYRHARVHFKNQSERCGF